MPDPKSPFSELTTEQKLGILEADLATYKKKLVFWTGTFAIMSFFVGVTLADGAEMISFKTHPVFGFCFLVFWSITVWRFSCNLSSFSITKRIRETVIQEQKNETT